ncbi:MAG: OmpA family protein [Elusimicrobia bacterium]|nr:OmpA family protein [Elusimicrobiota bacterium]
MINFYEESIGFSVKNINEPDIGLKTKEPIYREYRLGFAYLLGTVWLLEEAVPAIDLVYRNDELDYHVGWENWLNRRTVAVRLGGNKDEIDMGVGFVQDIGGSGMTLELNYALLWPLELEDTSGSHRVSLTVRFSNIVCDYSLPPEPIPSPAATPEPTFAEKAQEIIKTVVVKEEDRGLKVNLSSQIMFDSGKAVIKSRATKTLDEIVDLLNVYEENDLIIEGHTDSIGSMVFNQRLSEARANSVYTYLVKQGIDPDRIKLIGYGESKPVADNGTRAGRALNRRVEVIILKE